jgi:hypothetical protein
MFHKGQDDEWRLDYPWRYDGKPPTQTREGDYVPRYMVERTFPDGLAIPTNEQGRETTAKVAARNAEVGVMWVH